ncbi:DNA mismatch repair protein MutS [Mycoplasma sp. P36-A1]|uniref:DNA mismatch repair protein MutS n=1 Tax=Mycoplasma sp. P36-A1 TaxID=3252900 RepID=UPI003C2FF000
MDYERLTPMMKQYMEIKNKYQDAILFYRLGDFYEMFFEDALTASKVLEIALTGRSAGLEEKIPMCGVPFHASESYIKKLINNGFKVAICEQLEAPSKGVKIVKRDVVKIITPGTDLNIENNDYNYLMSISNDQQYYYIALADISTGKLKALKTNIDQQSLYEQIKNYQIKEIVVNENFQTNVFNDLLKTNKVLISLVKDSIEYKNKILSSIHLEYQNVFKQLLKYIEGMQMETINYYLEVEYQDNKHMQLDFSSKFSLELTSTIKNNEKYGTLFWYLDKTKTAMGSRLLKEYIENPLIDRTLIEERQLFVSALLNNFMNTEMIATYLKNVYDIARIASKLDLLTTTPKDLLWLANSLEQATKIKVELEMIEDKQIENYLEDYDDLTDLKDLIKATISEEILEGNSQVIIKNNINEQLDEYRKVLQESTEWLINFEQRQKELTNIKNLKVKYNKVFGYYIEVSNANKDLIKEEHGYIRKQTLANAERYINSELKEQESLILNASENLTNLENEIFNAFKKNIQPQTKRLQLLSSKLAYLDVMYALYNISNQYGFTKPIFNNQKNIEIKESFHPIIKAIDTDNSFVNNDYYLNVEENIMLITGPNMGGKSTYMRQLALIVIMFQIGCYVPAEHASLTIFDKIFTRIGSNDDLLEGQSTFMVEMLEASNAINNTTDNSLILFDELGRGTATYDGMSLAYAMIEHLALNSQAKVLFSTHYHELTKLADSYKQVINYHASVVEDFQNITFTYKIKPGHIAKSYGIHVAKLAHLPENIIKRSYEILNSLEQTKDLEIEVNPIEKINENSNTYSDYTPLKNEIANLNINEITPIQALTILDTLKKKVDNYE